MGVCLMNVDECGDGVLARVDIAFALALVFAGLIKIHS